MNRVKHHVVAKTSHPPPAIKVHGQTAAARQVANDLPRDVARNHSEHRAAELAALYETTLALTEQRALPELLQTIVARAAAMLAAPCALVYLYDEVENDLALVESKGLSAPPDARFQPGQALAVEVVRTHEPLIVTDAHVWDSTSLCAALYVPMLYSRELIGVLAVAESGTTTRAFTADDARLLSLVAVQAASVVHNARLLEQVRSSRARLEALSRRLLEAQEAERHNIARELHDEIGQAMTGVQLNLQAMDQALVEPTAHTLLQDSMVIIENVLRQVRNLSLDLRPSILDDFGLVAALQWLVKRQTQRAGLHIELDTDTLTARPSQAIETVCFRVAQEALTNVVRHARASRVRIELRQRESELQLLIRDDGIGFDVAQAMHHAAGGSSLGLLGMWERVSLVGARIEIESAPGQGTLIRAFFSLTTPPSFIERRLRRRSLR